MSRAWSWRNAILATKLSATTKHVLMVISTHMNDMGGGCYPSIKTIAELASLSERSVCTHIEIAADAGWLAVDKHGFNGQSWARHEYKALWPEGIEASSAPQRKGTERLSKGTEPDDKKALKEVQSIKLPIEHPKEHPNVREEGFQEFWEAYPRKVGKPVALGTWKRLKPQDRQAVLEALPRWKDCRQWVRDGGQFIPHPSTFLNQRRWEDDPGQLMTVTNQPITDMEKDF